MYLNIFLCHQKYMDIALRATSLLSEELSVDLLRYIGEMLFELFSMLCSVIYIIKILFITHTCTTAYNIHTYVFYVQIWLCKSFSTYVNDMFNILWYINTYICMLNAFVHGCVMNNILMIIITLHSIEKSSNITHPYTNALSTHIYVC